jgi:tetratricopeptide (TPR) repeat protein
MGSIRGLFSLFLVAAGVFDVQTANPQTHEVQGVVETLEGKPLSHMGIRIRNMGGTTTTDSGEFIFKLGPKIAPGQSIELAVEGDWVISSPWEGRTFVPLTGNSPIHVRVAHRGDPRLLADPNFVEEVIAGVTSQLDPLLGNGWSLPVGNQPEDYLASKAKETGLTVEEIKSAINVWISEVQTPYQKGLAALYAKRFSDASQFLRQFIAASENNLFPAYRALASAEVLQGHYVDAEMAVRKALAIKHDEPAALDLLGWTLIEQARFKEAEAAFELALSIDEKNYGKQSSSIAPHLSNLGKVYLSTGRFREAESALENALTIIDKANDRNDLGVKLYLVNFAEVLRQEGKYARARSEAERALAIASWQAGPTDLETAPPMVELGLIYKATGLYLQAEDMLLRVTEIDRRELGRSHPYYARDLVNLATVFIAVGMYKTAQKLLEPALSLSRENGRGESLDTATILCNLGDVYEAQEKYSDARNVLQLAHSIVRGKLGPESFQVAFVQRELGMLSFDEKKFTEAERSLRNALEIDERFYGKGHPNTSSDHMLLGQLYFTQELYAAAQSEYLLAYEAQVESLGPTHPEVGKAATMIALTFRKQGKEAEATRFDNLAAKALTEGDLKLPSGPDKP